MASRKRRVVWALGARDALTEALEFIGEDSPDGARRVLRAALDSAASLGSFSKHGRKVPECDDPNIREIFVYSYRMMYRVEADSVTIIAFLHGARDFERWARQQP